jgi:hypothetical protein
MNNIEIVKGLIKANGDKLFSVTFVKKDGSLRTLTGRLGVSHGKTKGLPTTAAIQKYLVVYDMREKGYRNVNVETVKSVSMGGMKVSFN